MRIGYGWDSHEFKRGVPLKLGGVTIKHPRGLAGHSDGDVLLHALTDALLGAVAAGDIGTFFPPSDPKWKDADSAIFVRHAMKRVKRAGYQVANVDSTLILAEPKIAPHAQSIADKIADIMGIPASAVGVKAKTPEGMGTEDAAIAHVVVLLTGRETQGKGKKTAEAEAPDYSDEVVAELLRTAHPEPARAGHEKKSKRSQ